MRASDLRRPCAQGVPVKVLADLIPAMSATRPRADPASKLLTAKGLLQGGDGDVRPSQIDDRSDSKDRKIEENSLHIAVAGSAMEL